MQIIKSERMNDLFNLFWDYQDPDSKSFDPAKEEFIIDELNSFDKDQI